jgi:hypothetical protein
MDSAVSRSWWLGACLALCACASEHHSTETGNPPYIDPTRVALVTRGGGVHVTGATGAVEPGGTNVSARNLTSGGVAHGDADDDGSFDLAVGGTLDDVFELHAGRGSASSDAVFVDRDGASRTYDAGAPPADAGALSCEAREQAAAALLEGAVADADVACNEDADCTRVSTNAVCHDRCQEVVVSRAGKAQIDSALDEVDHGVCGDYASDGCVFIAPPCIPPQPGTPACVNARCELAPDDGGALSCDERLSQAGARLAQAVADADRQCTSSSDCALAREITDCAGGCTADPVSRTGEQQVAAAIDAINAGVCANFEGSGCTRAGQPPCGNPTVECRANLCQFASP